MLKEKGLLEYTIVFSPKEFEKNDDQKLESFQ